MYCNNCGKEIPQGVKYCPYCGDKVLHNDFSSETVNTDIKPAADTQIPPQSAVTAQVSPQPAATAQIPPEQTKQETKQKKKSR